MEELVHRQTDTQAHTHTHTHTLTHRHRHTDTHTHTHKNRGKEGGSIRVRGAQAFDVMVLKKWEKEKKIVRAKRGMPGIRVRGAQAFNLRVIEKKGGRKETIWGNKGAGRSIRIRVAQAYQYSKKKQKK